MPAILHIDRQPLAEMNTTPLIDVLLVLLIMFIMAVPLAANVTPIDLPQPGPSIKERPIRAENTLSLAPSGAMTWNGAPIAEAELAATLRALTHLNPEPLVKFQPQPLAPYGASARALALVKQSGLASFAMVGNEQFADFGKAAVGN